MEKHQEDFEPVFEGMSFSNIECKGFPDSVTISNGKDLRNFETRDYVPLEAVEELIEKATPKKLKGWTVGKRLNRGIEFNCPMCNTVHHNKFNFCPNCGQAIDWGTYK